MTVPNWANWPNSMHSALWTAAMVRHDLRPGLQKAFRWAQRLPSSWPPGRNVPIALQPQETKTTAKAARWWALRSRAVLIVDDVMSAGTAARESIALIQAAGATALAWPWHWIARNATGGPGWSAADLPTVLWCNTYANNWVLQVCAIARLTDLLEYLKSPMSVDCA